MQEQNIKKKISPWAWVSTLYFAEGLPYAAVTLVSLVFYQQMGLSDAEVTFYTSWFYLPWVIKPLWSPFVDILRTKRWWIIMMQIVMSIAFILLTFSIPHPSPEVISATATPVSLFTFTLILFVITAFASATHDIAADGFYMLALNQQQQSFFVGIRSTFYRLSSIFGQGVLVYIAGVLETRAGNIPWAWTITMAITAVMFSCITIYHTFFVPRAKEDAEKDAEAPAGKETRKRSTTEEIFDEFARTFSLYFKKPGVLLAIVFMLLYRLPEAFLLKMVSPFLLDTRANGGLGLSTESVGFVYGTIGVIFLTVGGIIGGMAASRWGLKKSMWPMAACMTLPCFTFVYLSMAMPTDLVVISVCVAIEQFGYGFGFTAYMLYMMYFSEGEFKTAHYAICTAFMAASMMIPGMAAGYLQELLGYEHFFWMVIACCIATVGVTLTIKVNPEYGRKRITKDEK